MEQKFTIEELEAQYKALGAELEARKKAEAAEKEAKLRAEKEKRYNEVVAAYKKFEELRTAYVDDYGYFTFETKTSNNDSFDWLWKSVGLM